MGWTNQRLIDAAFAEIALANWDWDITPEERQYALDRLQGMMGTWSGQGVTLPYAFGGDLDADSNLPLQANEATYLNLAIRVAAGKGKSLAQSTKTTAKQAYDSMLVWIAHQQVQAQQFRSGTPSGAGNRSNYGLGRRAFLPPPDTDPLQNSATDGLTFNGS